MENNKQREKQKLKVFLKIVIIAFAVLLLILVVLFLLDKSLKDVDKKDYTDKDESIYYFSADYDADPLDDEVYAAKNRDIMFTDHAGNGEPLTAQEDGKGVKALFYDYFTALMTGDSVSHSALLTENYKTHFEIQEKFTPQKVYDISIKFLTGGNADGNYIERYQVTYKIYKNDGTYRADVGSNVAKIMVFEVTTENGRTMINSIVPMNIK